MKRYLLFLVTAAFAVASVFSQDLEPKLRLDGEVKTGIFWKEFQDEGKPVDTNVRLHSKDDAGGEGDQGRFRLNVDYDRGDGFGFKARLQWQNWMENAPQWPYAFGYGNFLDEQMFVSIGKLGGSPWGTGGPEKWKELETASGGGMRIEWRPSFVPGKLNTGFVLNWFDAPMEATGATTYATLTDILMESVLGLSYANDYFLFRFAYRLDSKLDRALRGTEEYGEEGGKLVYRFEEHMLNRVVPGFSIWALGVWEGVGADDPMFYLFENWLFIQYAPDLFTVQIRLGYDVIESRDIIHVKPSFFLNLFDKQINIGSSFWYGQDYGEGKMFEGSPFLYMEVEPKVQFNFSHSYIAFVFNFRREYIKPYPEARGADPIRQTQWMNLRFCIYY